MQETVWVILGAVFIAWLVRRVRVDMKRHNERWARMSEDERRDQFSWDAW